MKSVPVDETHFAFKCRKHGIQVSLLSGYTTNPGGHTIYMGNGYFMDCPKCQAEVIQ